jgi:cytochrome c-type biogenesis protein CcmH/NrfG
MLIKALDLYPTSLYTQYQLALTYEATGRHPHAVQAWTQTVALPPRNSFEVELKADAQKRLNGLGRGSG